jgi:tRNA A-37 threonylcarbamoyl transferase component Bud32
MGNSLYKKISKGKMRGWVRGELLELLPSSFFEDPISFIRERGGEVIKESKLRWAAILPLSSGRKIFFKRDKTKGWFESLKFLFLPSKARKEWFIAYQLQKRKLNIPQPLGWMEKVHRGLVKESYFFSDAIGTGASLIEDSNQLRDETITAGLAKTVKEIHDSGLFHKDLHAGNFLWDGESFFLTDLHRAKIIRSLSLNQRLWNLSQLFHSLRFQWGETERVKFIEKYFEREAVNLEKKEVFLQKVHSLMGRLQKRQWQSRTKRCLKESTEFSIQKERGVSYYHRRDFPLGSLKKIIEDHLRLVEKKPSILVKHSSEVTVSLLGEAENRVSVKHYHPLKFFDRFKERFRRSKGLKAWIAGNGLITRGVPSLKPFALVERRDWLGLKESFFLMEASETGQELDRYLFRGFKDLKEKRLFIKAFAQWVSHLHKMDLYHQDMKTCNILVSEKRETWDFHLLDWEDLLLDKEVNLKKLSRNLFQLNASTPRIMTMIDRLRFLHQYLLNRPVSVDKKRLVKEVDQKTRKRGVVYVAPWGVVEERPDLPMTYRSVERSGTKEVLRSAEDDVPMKDTL